MPAPCAPIAAVARPTRSPAVCGTALRPAMRVRDRPERTAVRCASPLKLLCPAWPCPRTGQARPARAARAVAAWREAAPTVPCLAAGGHPGDRGTGQGGIVDITQLILDDHHEQRRLFAILEQGGRTDTAVLSAVWARLGAFLELHAAAEEAIFYPALLQVGLAAGRRAGAEGETLDAIRDHNDIRDAVAEVARHQAGSDGWFDAVAAANLANSDHMAEEEREGLTDFRRLAGLQQRHDLAVAFAAFQAQNFAGVPAVDRDPESYIRQAEQDLQPRATGSLDIGSLKGQ